MPKLEIAKNQIEVKPKKQLSFPTREFKKVEYVGRDGQPAQGYMIKKDKMACEIVSGSKKFTLPVDKVQEIEPKNGNGSRKTFIEKLVGESEQYQPTPNKPAEDKFNYLDQYDNKEIPEDWAIIGRDASGNETLLLGDVAGVDVMDDDPNAWMFVDAKARTQMIVDRREIFDVRADRSKSYFFTDFDENGREFTHHGYLSTVVNGRCFFESAQTEEVLLLDTSEVFSANDFVSVAKRQAKGDAPEETAPEQNSDLEDKRECFDYQKELVRQLDQVIISPLPRTTQQKFIEMGRTKTMIANLAEEEHEREDSMAEWFVAKTADRLRTWRQADIFKYFSQNDWQELGYEKIYQNISDIKEKWHKNQKNIESIRNIQAGFKGNSKMSAIRYRQEQLENLLLERTTILQRMNFVKKQANKLDYLQQWEENLAERLGENVNCRPGGLLNSLTAEEKGIVARYIRPKISSKYSSREFECYLEKHIHHVAGEITTVRQLNAGQWRHVFQDIWSGIKESWARFDEKLADWLNQSITISEKNRKNWWQRAKDWFKG